MMKRMDDVAVTALSYYGKSVLVEILLTNDDGIYAPGLGGPGDTNCSSWAM